MESLTIAASFIAIAGVLSFELGVSTSILEIVAGIIARSIFGITNLDEINVLAHLGVVSLMYAAGLEIDLDLLRKYLKSSFAIGFSSFFTPFVIIFFTSILVFELWVWQAMLVAIALSTTSLAIVYPVLLESGPLSPLRKNILCAAMVTDLFSMIALSLFFSDFGGYTIALIIFLGLLTVFVPLLGSKIFKHYKGNTVELEFRMVLVLILGLTIISKEAGIEAAIIAFMAGMITSGIVVNHHDLQEKFKFFVFGFLAPVFFFSVGLSVSFIDIIQNIPFLVFFFIVCFIGKYVGTYIPAKKYIPGKEGFISLLFNSRLSLGIIAATFGYETGILPRNIYAPVIGIIMLAAVSSAVVIKKKGGYRAYPTLSSYLDRSLIYSSKLSRLLRAPSPDKQHDQ